MKFMFGSDIHGSYGYAKNLFDCFKKEEAEKLILLGDLLYHGPRNDLPEGFDPKALTALLNEHKNDVLCVRGNCDAAIDQMVLKFPMMADYIMMYVDGHPWFITHGDLFDETKEDFYAPGTILIHGHTHLKVMEKTGDVLYLNPGSVSLPKDDERHSYMIYEDGVFTIRDLDGNDINSILI